MLFSLKQIPIPEIVRYALGTALPSPIPQEFLSLAQNAAQEVLSCCQPKYHLVRYPVQPLLDSFLTGEDIRRHLSGCSDCVLLCATLGSDPPDTGHRHGKNPVAGCCRFRRHRTGL